MSKTMAEQLKEKQVAKIKKEKLMVTAEEIPPVEVIEALERLDVAMGICQLGENNWALVTIKYNPITKEATIDEVKDGYRLKSLAVRDFKVETYKRNIII